MRVRIEEIRFGPNPPAGMNPYVVMSLAYQMRSSTRDPEPVEITREDGGWRVHDGRHRVVAAMMAGRPDVLCVEVDST